MWALTTYYTYDVARVNMVAFHFRDVARKLSAAGR
jgi:hypothetical protein